jgi:hypothetical protein
LTIAKIFPDGFIWVDASSAAPTFNVNGLTPVAVAKYQTTTPTGTITGAFFAVTFFFFILPTKGVI